MHCNSGEGISEAEEGLPGAEISVMNLVKTAQRAEGGAACEARAKFQVVNLDNPAFHKRVGRFPGGVDVLKGLGFADALPPAAAVSPGNGYRELATALEDTVLSTRRRISWTASRCRRNKRGDTDVDALSILRSRVCGN